MEIFQLILLCKENFVVFNINITRDHQILRHFCHINLVGSSLNGDGGPWGPR